VILHGIMRRGWLVLFHVKDVGSSFLKLLAFLKVVLICAERKTMLDDAIKT